MTARIRLTGVRKSFSHKGGDLLVLPGLDLEVAGAEVAALLGPSGCGKTTLLRLLAGLDHPDIGSVDFEPLRSGLRVGVVFQHYALYPWMTVERNISTPVELVRRVPRRAARELAATWLDRVGLGGFAGHYPAQLSGGMRQRVALARAFALDPHVLLMDEPFAALDTLTRAELHTLTQSLLTEQGRTTVLVTHDPMEAALLADRIVVLSPDGTVAGEHRVATGHPRAFTDLLVPPLVDVVEATHRSLERRSHSAFDPTR